MSDDYRVLECDGWYEPQMKYKAGVAPGKFWFPLDRNGYWADPDAYSTGASSVRVLVNSPEIAQAIIELAKRINQQ